ncbi:MAG TPA: SIMPL domain-containing protein [Gaiellaceae bacterium]|nr:SIMPL domain-containing protein [Gaiellaceae bacterium]
MRRIALAAAALASLAVLAATLRTGDAAAVEPDASGGITVQGSATASTAPAKAQLTFGVETRADTAKGALAANATAMRKMLAALRAAGGGDLRTQSVWVSSFYGENGPQGFTATNSVTTSAAIGKAGGLIDAAVDAGANQVSGPSMSAEDEQALYRQALKQAVADARERAKVLADAAGVSLGRVTEMVESGGGSPPVMFEAAKAAADSTPIEPGRREVTATVSVTFALS